MEEMSGPVLGIGRRLLVFGEEDVQGLVVVLAEEVGIADGFFGERRVHGEGGRGQQKGCG